MRRAYHWLAAQKIQDANSVGAVLNVQTVDLNQYQRSRSSLHVQSVAPDRGVGTTCCYGTLRWRGSGADGMRSRRRNACGHFRPGGLWNMLVVRGRWSHSWRRVVLIVNVEIRVKSGMRDAFVRETNANVGQSRKEPGIFAFDLLVDPADDHHFLLVEGYRTEQAPAAHKQTPHYAVWRETVEPMMAVPRVSTKWGTLDSRG